MLYLDPQGYKCRDCDFRYIYEADIVLHRRSMHREAPLLFWHQYNTYLLAMMSKEERYVNWSRYPEFVTGMRFSAPLWPPFL